MKKLSDKMLALKNDEEELRKCKESGAYFYNNYIRQEGERELTEEEWENHVKEVDKMRNTPTKIPRHLRREIYPLSPTEAFNKFPDHIKWKKQ